MTADWGPSIPCSTTSPRSGPRNGGTLRIMALRILILFLAVTLAGCSQPPKWLAHHYNSQDPCQRTPAPNWCKTTQTYPGIYNTQGRRTGEIRKN